MTLKTIGLVILFVAITWVVAEFLINAIMLMWVYPYPEESYRYVVMDAYNYQAFFQLA